MTKEKRFNISYNNCISKKTNLFCETIFKLLEHIFFLLNHLSLLSRVVFGHLNGLRQIFLDPRVGDRHVLLGLVASGGARALDPTDNVHSLKKKKFIFMAYYLVIKLKRYVSLNETCSWHLFIWVLVFQGKARTIILFPFNFYFRANEKKSWQGIISEGEVWRRRIQGSDTK